MISLETKGSSFSKTSAWLKKMSDGDMFKVLDRYGETGRRALASATPMESGLASASWTYEVKHSKGSHSITWFNTNKENGFPVAIMLQYGYGTGTGGYVKGQDYINPAIRPIFDQIADAVWREVTRA